MKNTTIRISGKLLNDIKQLKDFTGLSTYEDVLNAIVKKELRKTHAFTKDGYLPVGAVVKDKGKLLVIKSIIGDKVVFDDYSYAMNGGSTVYELSLVAMSLEDCVEGRQNAE